MGHFDQSEERISYIKLLAKVIVWIAFGLSLSLIAIRTLGFHFELMPGDITDARFNNFVLEHFYRWTSGLDKGYWNAPIFYPFLNTIAFSDNLLGSAPFYALFRLAGLDKETAYQGWYILGCFFNFCAASYVLRRFKLSSLAILVGAFFFTFGLPVLAQEIHAQLLYRFGVPLACFLLWEFYNKPRLVTLSGLLFWFTWQFYMGIYNGVFLLLLLSAMAILLPFWGGQIAIWERFKIWPRKIKEAWLGSNVNGRIIWPVMLSGLFVSIILLLAPYITVSKIYSFSRSWKEIATMLPRWQSYLIADNAQLWKISPLIAPALPMRQEHQLFPGMASLLLIVVGLIWRSTMRNREIAWFNLSIVIIFVVFTLNIKGFSFYHAILLIPGIRSIRAVSRFQLVLLWPLAVYIACVIENNLDIYSNKHFPLKSYFICCIAVLLFFESGFYTQMTLLKSDAQKRLSELRTLLPYSIPDKPILFVAVRQPEPAWYADVDGMLLSQDLGWSTFNGYSGNVPLGYGQAYDCIQLPERILSYMRFAHISDSSFYQNMMKRAVPIGFDDCNPDWWNNAPRISMSAGAFSPDIFTGIAIKILSISKSDDKLMVSVEIENHSSSKLPAVSTTGNNFLLSWRFVDYDSGKPLSDFDARRQLDADIPPGTKTIIPIFCVPPQSSGKYYVEVNAVQELIAWFSDRGMNIARSSQNVDVYQDAHFEISTQ